MKYRLKAEKEWPSSSSQKYYTTLNPGKYSHYMCVPVPLGLLLCTHLGVKSRIVTTTLRAGSVKVNNRVIRTQNYPTVALDIVQYCNEYYRVILNRKYNLVKLQSTPILYSVCKQITKLKNGKLQLNCVGGKNVLLNKLNNLPVSIKNTVLTHNLITNEYALVDNAVLNRVCIVKGKYRGRTFENHIVKDNRTQILPNIFVDVTYCTFYND